MQNQTIERTTLTNLLNNEEYSRKVLPFIKPEYFDVKEERIIFDEIQKFVDKYNKIPTQTSLEIEVSTRKDLNDVEHKKIVEIIKTLKKETRDMSRAQILKAAFRVLTLKLGKAKVPMVVTNHTYDVIGSMFPTKEMGGGSGLKYAASSIIYLSKKKFKDGTEVIGNIIHCKNHKSRLTMENKMVDVLLTYDKGLDKYYGLLDLAVAHGIFKQVSTRIELPDGTKQYAKTINNDPEKYFTKEVMEKLEEAALKEFKYGNE